MMPTHQLSTPTTLATRQIWAITLLFTLIINSSHALATTVTAKSLTSIAPQTLPDSTDADKPVASQSTESLSAKPKTAAPAKKKQAASTASPKSEFLRALSIIEQTQLTIFRDTAEPPSASVIAQLEVRTNAAIQANNIDPDDQAAVQQQRIVVMRELLSETINSYEDSFANYIDPGQLKKYRERRSGNYVGIGLKFRAVTDDYPWVIGPLAGGPLDDSDIVPGDQLLKADDTTLKGKSSKEILSLLKGPADSELLLTLKRGDAVPHTVRVTRQAVALQYARAEVLKGNVGYIKISRFGGKTHQLVGRLVGELLDKNVSAFVLDLRDNPGGSTRAAREIVSMFTKEETVYCEQYKSNATRNLPRQGNHMTDKPLAVLVNSDSMSSSEIVAGAIKTYKRGTIIGTPTYGKGLVQKVFNLKPPLGGAIRTTIAMFGKPDHQLIHGVGILPDIHIKTPADFMFKQTGSLNISQSARNFHRELLENSVRKKHPEKAADLIAASDEQLNKALDLLHSEVASASE